MIERAEKIAKIINESSEKKPESPKLQELRKQLSGLLALGENPAFISAIDEVRSQITNEESKYSFDANQKEYLEILKISKNVEFLKEETVQVRTALYRHFVEKVIISDGQVQEVVLNF